tara:strand:- start:1022 stop:1561 length:540 start_codon:yes stop_codon:yes gene_type:complete
MGCDIHSFAEVKRNNKWELVTDEIFPDWGGDKSNEPFSVRSYSVFAFLAGVRNYDHCEPISECKGLPLDSEYLNKESGDWMGYKESVRKSIYEDCDYHSHSYLTLKELLNFDYTKTFWNRRVTKQTSPNSYNGASLAEEGEGEVISYKDNLGEGFFDTLNVLGTLGNPKNVRIIFWFDN